MCKTLYTPVRPLQVVCSITCARAKHAADKAKKEAKELREAKKRIKTRAQWLKDAQAVFNRYIRLRDAHLPCISCGRWHEGQWHAGHFLTTKARPELRFDERNVNKQCAPCNNHLSGNISAYRIGLAAKYGQSVVDWLEGPHDLVRLEIEDIECLIKKYKAKIKELENAGVAVVK